MIKVHLSRQTDNSYVITIGRDLFAKIALWAARSGYGRVAVITDSNVKRLYGNKLLALLKRKKVCAELFSFKAGEPQKSRRTKEQLEDALTARMYTRDSLIIALGGGVAGDLAGFVASTYMRGIPFIQVPTTLLAMVDSSIGGKTGVDTAYGKNLIGTFCQPKAVFIDVSVLQTLPGKEMLNGIVEMVKHGIIADAVFFRFMRDNIDNIYRLKQDTLIRAIKRSCEIKRSVVEKDEKENNLRRMLNFGHTVGHAIEQSSNYRLSHGASVALGIIVETTIAEQLNLISPKEAGKIKDVILQLGIKPAAVRMNTQQIIKNILYDKKNTSARTNYVLPIRAGAVKLNVHVKEQIVRKALNNI